MKQPTPDRQAMLGFELIQGKFIAMILLGAVVWFVQDFVASFAAHEQVTETTLRTTEEPDDTKVLSAFQSARRSVRVEATLQTEANPQQRIRDAVLTVTAPTKREALEGRQAMTETMQATFAHDGKGELFDIGHSPSAQPVPNATMNVLKQVCRLLALALVVFALVSLFMTWRRANLPKRALLGILAVTLFLVCTMLGREGISIWVGLIVLALPTALIALVVHLTLKVRRAATWSETKARIQHASVVAERHRFSGDTTKVKNKAVLAYEFTVDGKRLRGDTITVGVAPADEVHETMRRYAVGIEVPVFYDLANPKECVLERDPPASMGCIWSGTVVGVLLYALIIFCISTDTSPFAWVGAVLPQLHHPAIVITTGLLGLLALASGIWHRLHPQQTVAWEGTPAKVVSSKVESYEESKETGSRSTTHYRAVIELSYTFEGHEYRAIKGESDLMRISVGNDRSRADAEVAQHPVGTALEIFYDPKNPTRVSMRSVPTMTVNGTTSLVMGAILIAVAIYAALN